MRTVGLAMLLVLALGWPVQDVESGILQRKLVLLPFRDETDFRGKWKIEREVPTYLGKVLAENPFYAIVPMDSVYAAFKGEQVPKDAADLAKMGERLGADLVLTGVIEDFNVSRFGLETPMLGGYQSFGAQVDVTVTLTRVIDSKVLGEVGGKAEVKDRAPALTLLGKPTTRDSQFYGLDTIAFGSEQFKETIIGEACLKAFDQLKGQIDETLGRPRQVTGLVLLLADSTTVYLNVGIEDGLEPGDKLGVYERGQELTDPQTGEVVGRVDDRKIGSVQVTELRAEHFSKARILEGAGVVGADHLVKTESAEAGEKQQ